MLILFTIIVMLIVGYCHFREGLFTAICMLVNVALAGLITFNFWEPLASGLESLTQRGFLEGYEDFLVLVLLFAICLGVLRKVTYSINITEIAYAVQAGQIGAGLVGLVTGYFLAGIMVCAMQTLPWNQHFMGFEPFSDNETPLRRYLPPDRVWLALMHRAGATCLSRGDEATTFDPDGAFESNYLRFRRTPDAPKPAPAK